jgi:hypothetical protein
MQADLIEAQRISQQFLHLLKQLDDKLVAVLLETGSCVVPGHTQNGQRRPTECDPSHRGELAIVRHLEKVLPRVNNLVELVKMEVIVEPYLFTDKPT